jgi:hypothetical protein
MKATRAGRAVILTLALAIFASVLWAGLALAVVGPPSVSGVTVSQVTETTARLQGAINPSEREVEAYFFEYVTQASFEASGFVAASKTPSGALPSGKEAVAVSAQIGGLTPGVTYHVRLFAKNKKGETEGPALAFSTFVTPPPFGSCPNDSFRGSSPSGALPDCRAYEQASPVDKNSGDLIGSIDRAKTSVNGDRVSFQAYAPIPGAEGAQEFAPPYLATRSAGQWSTQGLQPPQQGSQNANVIGWTPDFSHSYAWARLQLAGEPEVTALLDRDNRDGSTTTIVPHTADISEPKIPGSTDDGSIVFFEQSGLSGLPPLTPEGAKEKHNLYVWDRETGAYRLAGALNDGNAPPGGTSAGAEIGAEFGAYTRDQHAMSTDGSKVYFTAWGPSQLYLRQNPTEPQSPLNEGKCASPALACTFHVSASQRTVKGPDPAGPQRAEFMGASADGSMAFFTSSEMLTDNANTGPEQPPAQIGRAKIGESKGEEVKADFITTHAVGVAVSPDGEYIYWADPSTGNIGREKLNGEGLPTKKPESEYITPGPVEFDVEYKTGSEEKEIAHDHVSSPTHPRYVAVDSEYVYWTNTADGKDHHGTIGRAKIGAGGSVEVKPQLIIGASKPQGIAINTSHIYWADNNTGSSPSIARAELDGNGVQERFCDHCGNGTEYFGVALSESHVYFIGHLSGLHDSYVYSFPLEGGSVDGFIYLGHDKAQGVTADGSHVYWSVRDAQGGDGKNTPLQPSAIGRAAFSDFAGPGGCALRPTCEVEFVVPEGDLGGLASDGKRLYWSVNGEGAANPGNDLYRYEAATGKLSDLTPDSNPADANGAEVQGVLGSSEDGAYVYFAANGVLAEGASPGSCPAGKCNLYLDHEGQIEFIAPLNGSGDRDNWSPNARRGGTPGALKTSRISADGRTLLFTSSEKLTAYENAGTPELYRYRVGDPNPILCVSCNPTGLAPSGVPMLGSIHPALVASLAPAAVLSRNLSADGNRVFFETPEALVPSDTNGAAGCPLLSDKIVSTCQDVYQWEAKGTGSCNWEAQNGGCLYLISTGKSPEASYLADASASGDDVFLFTREQLVGQDEDSLLDVYDARVGGGLASQGRQVPPVPCEGEACKGVASAPPGVASPATPFFSGPGNQKPHRKKAKTKKKKKRHHKQKRNAKKHGRAHR